MSDTETIRHETSTDRETRAPRLRTLFAIVIGLLALCLCRLEAGPRGGSAIPPHTSQIPRASQQATAAELAARRLWNRQNYRWFAANGFSAAVEIDFMFGQKSKAIRYLDAPNSAYVHNEATEYRLGNQVPYNVTMGPVHLQFQGAVVRMIEGYNEQEPTAEEASRCFWPFNAIHAHSGWSTDVSQDPFDMNFSPEDGVTGVQVSRTWLKGYLTRQAIQVDVPPANSCGNMAADYVYRYQYHGPDGSVIPFYQRPRETAGRSTWSSTPPSQCYLSRSTPAPEPNFYWSDGNASLDTTNKCRPVIRWADGSIEEFFVAATVPTGLTRQPEEIAGPFEPSCFADITTDLHFTDRNGNVSTYHFGNGTQTLTDPKGRQTVLTYDLANGGAELRTVDLPSIGAAPPLRYTINWRQPMEVRFDLIWPDVICHSSFDGTVQPCSSSGGVTTPSVIDLVDSIVTPDGRSYRFEYGPWGNLTRVTEPGGAVHEYDYGGAGNLDYARAALPLLNQVTTSDNCGPMWSNESLKMQARGMTRERVFPDGPTGVFHETTQSFVNTKLNLPTCGYDVVGAARFGPDGCSQVWREVTLLPDGPKKRMGRVARADNMFGAPTAHGWQLGTETWSGSTMFEASYNGDKDTGVLYYDSDPVPLRMGGANAGMRPLKTVDVRDGLAVTTNLVYGNTVDIDPDPAGTESRNIGSATSTCAFAGVVTANGCSPSGGQPLARTDLTYSNYFSDAFNGRNLLGLPLATRFFGPDSSGTAFSATPLSEEINTYDEFDLKGSGLPSAVLDPSLGLGAGSPRGNITTMRRRVSATKTVAVQARYFDTGDVKWVTDAKGANTNYSPAFSLCSSSPTLTSSVTNPMGHSVTIVADCTSGLALKSTDANQSTFMQYDYLARPVETAEAGDVLTALPQTGAQAFTRYASAPTGGGSRPGDALVTSWMEYLSLGVLGQERTVVHSRDGSPGGMYTKAFFDGLGRTVQTRTKVDPAKAGGLGEVISTTIYDGMGRTPSVFSPCFAAVSDVKTPHCGTALATTITFDALGRQRVVTAPGNIVTANTYEQEGGRWLHTIVNPRGFKTKTYTNLLGQNVQVDEESPRCGGFCSTKSTYDAAGRLRKVIDPVGNIVEQTYDDLGRPLTLSHPDMGNWSYEYDDNGNVVKQTDAKGQQIRFTYDALDRLIVKDLPPAAANPGDIGPEDVTYFYDGGGPTPPADNPAPTVSSISPVSVQAGSSVFTLTVNGGNFVSGSVVRLNGQPRTTAFVSSAQLTAQIPAADVQTAGTFAITVFNAAPGGGVSGTATLTANNPTPAISTLSPSSVSAGSAAFTLTVNGSSFVSGCLVLFNGQPRTTTFVSSVQVTAQIPAIEVQSAGTFPVAVFNAAPGGGTSGPVSLTVIANNPLPAVSSISPPSIQAGSATFTLTVNGSNFVSGSVVRLNGQSRTTTFVSSVRLTAQIPAADIQTAGIFPITVLNAAPGGGASGTVPLTATNPVPTISSLNPTGVQAGSPTFTLTVNGGNFVTGCSMSFNGQNRVTTYISSGQVTVSILASEVQAAGTYPVTIFNPGPGGGASNLQNFTVTSAGTPLVLSKKLGTLRNDLDAYAGMKFTVGVNPIVVRSLGRIFVSGNAAQHTLKIVDVSSGAEVASVIVSMPGGTKGEFTYAELATAITLKAGSSYYLVSEEINGRDLWYDSDTVLTIADTATIDGPALQEGKDGEWTVLKDGSSFVPVDLKYEPTTRR